MASWLFGEIDDYDPKEPESNIMLVGSIANHADEHTIICGAGVAYKSDLIPKCKSIPMIRGAYSKKIAEASGNNVGILGDPVSLLPEMWPMSSDKKYRLGVIPHVVDYLGVTTRYMDHEDVLVIDLCKHPKDVVKDILSCEYCISSSLHGIVAAHAYGVPCEWVEFTNNVAGDGIKFLDYFSSVGIPIHEPINLREETEYQVPDYDVKIKFTKKDLDGICNR